MLGRQQELDAAGARADQRHGGTALARENAGLQRLEAAQESIDRFDRDGVLARARHAGRVRRRADIERQEIVTDGRSRAADHAAPVKIEIDHLVLIKPHPREPGERTGIDMRVIESVVTGDQSGQVVGGRHWRLAARVDCGVGADRKPRFFADVVFARGRSRRVAWGIGDRRAAFRL